MRVTFYTLGCKVNQNETGALAQPFAALLVAEVRHGAAVDDVDIRTFFIGDNGVAVFLKQLGQVLLSREDKFIVKVFYQNNTFFIKKTELFFSSSCIVI